jgi:hypothetical protein
MKNCTLPAIPLFILLIVSCTAPPKGDGLHFTLLPASATGVDFANTITENDSLNMFVNEYTYMGGGTGTGDFNNDGLPDVFFAGNQVSSRLYINKGGLQFNDVTQKAGVATTAWCTGVSVIDINNDGWEDIYVCTSGRVPGEKRKNLLFINQHNLTFTEEAAAYGLADTAYSTQAVFFDYDNDGRLDMYLLNHTLNDDRPNDIRPRRIDSNAVAADKLYHNEGIPPGMGHPVFKDASKAAGIVEDGNGLGIAVSDYNGDGYPDIYVANDYICNDVLWLNNGNGTFANCIATAIKHQSYSSMGTDAADLNNDGLPDILTLDMQPETNERKKMMYSFLNEQRHQLEVSKGYEPEYIHNMLQLNNGTRTINNRKEPFFSEIAQMAGISQTDWSWSVLAADFDNDGWKDIHITNGLGRDPTNTDFLEYRHKTVVESGIPDNDATQRKNFMDHLASLGSVNLRNYLYVNKGGLSFQDVSASAGIGQKSISNGAIYADLDNDGDLDVITSNINSAAFVMRNDTYTAGDTARKTNYLSLALQGSSLNKTGIGTTVYAYSNGTAQMAEQYPVRGYLSTVDKRLHLGTGNNSIDSLKIIWPDKKMQVIKRPALNTILQVNYADAGLVYRPAAPGDTALFSDTTRQVGIDFKHAETTFFDYQFQPLIPQKYSQEGPFISTGDVNGDGLQDFFIGGAYHQPGRVFIQQPGGSFAGKDLLTGTKNEEDMQSVLFDADGDKDLDLLVASGSSEFEVHSSFYRPRLYKNDGKGNFTLDDKAFSPLVRTPAKSLAVADVDGDGFMDVFIGGRVTLGEYPQPPASYLLHNNHGRFTDVTSTVCPAIQDIGLVNAAAWVDIDHDKKPDLIIAADWQPIRLFKNNGSTLTEVTEQSGLKAWSGFWRSLAVADIDNDGDLDIVAGNLGRNNPFNINAQQPAQLVAKDFDANGIIDPVFCYYIKGNDDKYQLMPGISRNEWARQQPSIKKKFEDNSTYASATMEQIFTKDMMDSALVLTCNQVQSGWFENDGHGVFAFHPFSPRAQEAPVNALVCADVTGDGITDILLAGNEYQSSVMAGRFDASWGLLLEGKGRGVFAAIPPAASGLVIDGDTKDLKLITAGRKTLLLCAINDAKLQALNVRKK